MQQVVPDSSRVVPTHPVSMVNPNVVNNQPVVEVVNTQPNMQEVIDNTEVAYRDVEHVDPNIVTLSTGWTVRFSRLPKNISDSFVTKIFNATELDKDNNIRISDDKNEQIKVASKFMDLNASIIGAGGVELLDELPPDEQWLEALQFSPIIVDEHPHVNWNKPSNKAREVLFLKYYAFGEDDISLLSERSLHQG